MTKRLILTALLVLGLGSACTPTQIQEYKRLTRGDYTNCLFFTDDRGANLDGIPDRPEVDCDRLLTTWRVLDEADEVIQEDDPRWDCHTMGNKVCGTP